MKFSKYWAVLMSICTIGILLDPQSPAQGVSLELPTLHQRLAKSTHPQTRILAQNLEGSSASSGVNKNFRLQDITIKRNNSDKSLLTVAGLINNRSEQSHYVYYIVAKFISKDTSIKQTIIPVNIDIKAGESQSFTHEISTATIESISPETVKPVVVKYEYR
jgi:hypothetical protein